MDSDIRHEFEELKRRVKALEDKYKHIDDILGANTNILNKISDSLTGDNYTSGWIMQIKDNKQKSEENEKRLNQIKYWAAGASASAILLAELVTKILGF